MNAQQLQAAIDSAREFVLKPLAGYATAAKAAQESAVVSLKKLEEIQAIRAGMMAKPTIGAKP